MEVLIALRISTKIEFDAIPTKGVGNKTPVSLLNLYDQRAEG